MSASDTGSLRAAVVGACKRLEEAGHINESWRRDGPLDGDGPMPLALVAGVAEAISAAKLGYERGLRDGRLKVEASEWVRLNTFAVRRCDVVRVAIEPDPPRVVVIVGGDALAVTGMTFDEVVLAVSGLEVA